MHSNSLQGTAMSEPTSSDPLKALEARIADAKKGQDGDPPMEEHYSQAQQGWRMVTEMVAGLLIGFGMGYGLDALFGTLPIFMVLFTIFGLVAGIKTMMRTAEEIQNKQLADQADRDEKG